MIKQASIKDFDNILPMFLDLVIYNSIKSGQLDSWYSSKNWKSSRENELRKAILDKNGYLLVAKINNKIVGYSYGFYLPQQEIVVLEELFVDKNFRKMGIGRDLVNKSVSWGKGYSSCIKVEVYPWNTEAIKFYEKIGFNLESYEYELKIK